MRFLIDNQLPASLAPVLTNAGHEAVHVLDVNLGQSSDVEIWNYAASLQAVILTKDEDFAERIMRGKSGVSVIWLRMGNCSNRQLLALMAEVLPQIVHKLDAGERLIEVY